MNSLSPYVIDGIRFEPMRFDLPLDHSRPGGERIGVFARALCRKDKLASGLPWLLFLQGGPGFGSPRPVAETGWLKRVLAEFRVLLLDPRGTGRSTPVSAASLAGRAPAEQAAYLSHFRADGIVRDAEAIRAKLSPDRPWSLLGQSYGGFCCFTYLSLFPDSLREVYMTGGVPPIGLPADEVYRATWRIVAEKNRAFFARFPHAQGIANRLAALLLERDVRLPNGQRLSVEQLQQLGIELGTRGPFEELYYLLEDAFVDGELDPTFVHKVMARQSFPTHPIYAILHESIYAEGASTRWAAERTRAERPGLSFAPGADFAFTGEMVFPWMFEQFRDLAPLRDAAHLLAEKDDWGPLYDRAVLERNKVPVACAVYADDMFVSFEASRDVLRWVPGCRAWITNEYEHNGLRADGERILDRLIRMNRDR